MDDDIRQSDHKDWEREDWEREIRSYNPEQKLRRAEHLWNEYQYRHDLVWNLVFRLTAAVVVLAIIPYTQDEVMSKIHRWILAPPFLGWVLAIVGLFRVHHELRLLDHIRDLYWRLQDSLFYDFHGGKKSWFGASVRTYIIVLIVLASLNILFIINCWIPQVQCPTILGAFRVS